MRRLFAFLVLVLPTFAADSAEAKYLALLDQAERSQPGTYDIYTSIVSPLAEIYKQNEETDKLEALYVRRVDKATPGLDLGLAQADLGFHYQRSEVSADRFHGERYIETALKTFEQCAKSSSKLGDQCRRRLADTAGIQGAIYFQKLNYKQAEPLFRQVVSMPEPMVQAEVLFVSLHALRGILILRQENEEARALLQRAERLEENNQAAVTRLRSRSE